MKQAGGNHKADDIIKNVTIAMESLTQRLETSRTQKILQFSVYTQ